MRVYAGKSVCVWEGVGDKINILSGTNISSRIKSLGGGEILRKNCETVFHA